jgi:hypothetical protein
METSRPISEVSVERRGRDQHKEKIKNKKKKEER